MSKKKFTEEERKLLYQNPYTTLVTENTLSFTIEFKELFWKDYCKGLSPRKIISQCGYDPEMLGPNRLDGILYSVKKAALTGKGFSNTMRPVRSTDQSEQMSTPEADIRGLKQRVKYLEQEIEYLKKISAVRTSKG